MKILFNTYTMAFQHPGGGEVVILKLKDYLERRGHEVKLFDKWSDKVTDYDIVHEFSLLEWEVWKDYKDLGLPLVLTPTAWPRNDLKSLLKNRLKNIYEKHNLTKFLKYPDVITPTTSLEKDRLRKLYRIPQSHFNIVPNGVDLPVANKGENTFTAKYGLSDYLLYVGSIAENKNLLGAIEVANRSGNKLIVIGDVKVGHEDYFNKCKNLQSENIHFIGRLQEGEELLTDAYRAAKCLLVLSDFETCSLVAMEAGAVGTPVLLTKYGGTKEVFKNYVNYVDPLDLDSVLNELNNLKSGDDLRQFILANYTWNVIAEKLENIYKKLIK